MPISPDLTNALKKRCSCLSRIDWFQKWKIQVLKEYDDTIQRIQTNLARIVKSMAMVKNTNGVATYTRSANEQIAFINRQKQSFIGGVSGPLTSHSNTFYIEYKNIIDCLPLIDKDIQKMQSQGYTSDFVCNIGGNTKPTFQQPSTQLKGANWTPWPSK